MEMDGDKDAEVTKKIEKKDKRKKKREAKAVADLVKDHLNKMEKKRKKDKRKAENYTGKSEDKESKRGVTDCTEPMPNLEDGNRYGKTENKEKKRKKKTEVGYETNKEKILGKEFAEVVDNYESENNEKKKKKDKRKTEVGSETNTSESFEKIRDRTEKKKKKKVREKAENMGKGESTAAEYDEKTSKAEISEKAEKKRKREKNNDEATAAEYVEKISKADSEKVEKKRKREKNNGKKCKDGEKITHSTKTRSVGNETKGDKMSNDQDANAVENNSKDSKPKKKKKKKKVSFSDHNEVFPLEGGIVQGKRFSPEEDKMVKQAVFDYIDAHGLGDEGLTMVLHCKSHPKVKNCWKEIGQALPYRPYTSVYDRAHSLFERDQTRRWSSEELEIVRKYHAEHGSKWKQLADGMGKHRRHVKDAWRRTKLPDRKKGHWSQEEYQALFDLVNVDLRAKVNEEKKSKHGMLKDNISWMAISDSLASRSNVSCCKKWYDQLTSSMVKEGDWADTDDYHLIDALYTLDACCIEDVDWDSLLEYRSGDLCRKRWKQMANHIGENGVKTFVEKVEILSKRYCAELLEAREIWDNKPRVP